MVTREGISVWFEVLWIKLRTVLRLFLGLIGSGIIAVAMWYGAIDGLAALEAHSMAGSPGMAGEVVGPVVAPWAGLFFVGALLMWIAYR